MIEIVNGGTPRILVLASGTKTSGGSGFQELVEATRTDPPILNAEIVAVISNHENGGVYEKAINLGIPFEHWAGPHDATGYRDRRDKYQANHTTCSGWLPWVTGLEVPDTTNIHPGPVGEFGGQGMHGNAVHKKVMTAYREGRIKQSAVTMHFVTEDGYDRGPIICQFPVLIRPDDTWETLKSRVNEKERAIQAHVLNLVVNGDYVLHNGKVLRCLQVNPII